MDTLNKTNIQREGSYETRVSILVLGSSELGGWGWPLTLGLKANIWGSLGSTTEGYGSKMTTFLGDSNADLHMDTNKSTTLKNTRDKSPDSFRWMSVLFMVVRYNEEVPGLSPSSQICSSWLYTKRGQTGPLIQNNKHALPLIAHKFVCLCHEHTVCVLDYMVKWTRQVWERVLGTV